MNITNIKCPDCEIDCVCNGCELKFKHELKTAWYGLLKYYRCGCCKTTFVSQGDGELETAALQ
jgi:hypothetical protein